MKRGVMLLMLILMMGMLCMPLAAAALEITLMKYEPYPIEPGEHFTLWIKIENPGSSDVPDATCALELKYPFSMYSGDIQKSYGILSPGEDAILKYELKVDEDAVGGDHEIRIKCADTRTSDTWVYNDETIKIQSRYGILNIKSARTIPEMVAPGEKAILWITLENMADYMMSNIDIKLNFTGVDIAPYGEAAQKKIGSINKRSAVDVSFGIVPLPEASGGIYKVPISLTYTDVTGKNYSESSMISIEVGSEPEIYVIVDSTTIHKFGIIPYILFINTKRTGEIIVKVVNPGLTDLKFLDVKLEGGKGFKVMSSKKVYIGDLDSDDYETAEFRIKVGWLRREITLPLQLEYRDSSNNPYSEQVNLTLYIRSARELGQSTSKTGIIILLLVVGAYLFYRYKSKKKGKK